MISGSNLIVHRSCGTFSRNLKWVVYTQPASIIKVSGDSGSSKGK